MRSVFKPFQRATTLLVLLTILVTQGVAAADRDDGNRGLRDRYQRAKRFVVTVLGRFSIPPG